MPSTVTQSSTPSSKSLGSLESEQSIEKFLEHDGIYGISYNTLLCFVALGGLFIDCFSCYLTLNHVAVYGFAFSMVCSLVCFCTTISCIQENKTTTLRRTGIWPAIKFLVTAIVFFCAIVFVVESNVFVEDSVSLTLNFKHKVLLGILAISLIWTLIHYQVTKKASFLMHAKDKFYTIENNESTNASMRASLRLYLAARMLQNYEKF